MSFKNGFREISPIEKVGLYIFLTLSVIVVLFPIACVLFTSFKLEADVFSTKLQILPPTWTLENYKEVIFRTHQTADGETIYIFLKWVKNSLTVALATSVMGVMLASSTAYSLSRFRFPGKKMAQFAFLMTQMFPGIILIIPLFKIMKTFGLIDNYWGLIIAYSATSLPFCVFMLKGFFDTIPKSLEEAARMDGLGPVGIFWRIILPLSLPGIAVTAFFSLLTAWNEYMLALTFITSEESLLLPIGIGKYIHEFGVHWHLLSAASMLITIPIIFLFLWVQKFIVGGGMAGAVKG